MIKSADEQYLELGRKILEEGVWVENERTGKKCLTIINHDMVYDVGAGAFPLLTTKKTYWKSAIAEILGYLKGYDNAEDFRKLGTKTWDANANMNDSWLANPHRKGKDDMGYCYGALARNWPISSSGVVEDVLRALDGVSGHALQRMLPKVFKPRTVDVINKVLSNLSKGIDDRGEIITFYNPGEIDKACLRSCMYEHHFSILDGTLHLNSTQRSIDTCLGLPFNMAQVYVLLLVVSMVTGLKPGKAYHKLVNVHIYEDQLELFKEQMSREPMGQPKLIVTDALDSLDYLYNHADLDDFSVTDYEHHPAISYPFAV